jgi:IPT/TIG domain
MGIARLAACALISFSGLRGLAQSAAPEILALSPISGPEGALVEIRGKNLAGASAVLFGATRAVFEGVSPQTVIAIVPHRVSTSIVTVITPQGRGSSPFAFVVSNNPRIPDEVSYKAGYVNPERLPAKFGSARLWGIAIADTRVQGHELAQVEVAWTRLSCRVDGREVVLNDDGGRVSGGLYQRWPWFATDAHDPMPLGFAPADQAGSNPAASNQAASNHDSSNQAVVLRVGQRADRVWHFWSPSPRAALPAGKLEGCTVRARVRISAGALLQMGMDYWLSPTVPYGSGGNNHEAGASNWYFPSPRWQEATFTDVGGPQF